MGSCIRLLSVNSICTKDIVPTFDELEKFSKSGKTENHSLVSSSRRKKACFMKGDVVFVSKGEPQNLRGCVEKVEEEYIHIKPEVQVLPKTVMVNINEICKYFEPGNHVNIVAGAHLGASGMAVRVRVEQNAIIVLSDSTKAHICVGDNNAVKSSEVIMGAAKIGGYGFHDLVLLNDTSFGIIIGIESDVFRVLKGVIDKTEVASVRMREIKSNIQRKSTMQDRYKNAVSVKDIVKIKDGPFKVLLSTYIEESCSSVTETTMSIADLFVPNPVLVLLLEDHLPQMLEMLTPTHKICAPRLPRLWLLYLPQLEYLQEEVHCFNLEKGAEVVGEDSVLQLRLP